MSDIVTKSCRCTVCDGVLEHAVDQNVPSPSIGAPGVWTDEPELVCDDCCKRLAAAMASGRTTGTAKGRSGHGMAT